MGQCQAYTKPGWPGNVEVNKINFIQSKLNGTMAHTNSAILDGIRKPQYNTIQNNTICHCQLWQYLMQSHQ